MYFIRHGQASFAADNYDKLSALGIEQSTLVGDYLRQKNCQPDHIVCGTMLRHQQTAQYSLNGELLAGRDFTKISTNNSQWNEYDHQNILAVYKKEFANAQGMRQFLSQQPDPHTAFEQHFVAAIEQWINAKSGEPYNESWQQFCQRVISAFTELCQQQQGKTIIIYSSGGPISLIISHLLGLPLEEFIRVNWSLVNAGVTKIISRGKQKNMTLASINEHHIFDQQNDKRLITYT